MAGLDRGEVRGDRVGDLGHRGGVVPQVGVRRAVRQAEQLLHHDRAAAGVGDRLLDRVHERVVAQAVLHHEPGRVDQAAGRRARLERVRVRIGVAHDGAGLHVLPADLRDDVRVLALRADRDDRAVRRGRCRARRRTSSRPPAGPRRPGRPRQDGVGQRRASPPAVRHGRFLPGVQVSGSFGVALPVMIMILTLDCNAVGGVGAGCGARLRAGAAAGCGRSVARGGEVARPGGCPAGALERLDCSQQPRRNPRVTGVSP